jgi:Fur family ferric uptake transcriptional regulator
LHRKRSHSSAEHYDEVVTLSPSAQPARFTDLEGALSALRTQGLRISVARRLVLEALFTAAGPLSAEEITESASRTPVASRTSVEGTDRDASLDAASVYRNLEAFERAGVVRHVHLGHGPGLYALVGEGEREYLYCERCHTAVSLAPAKLDEVRELIHERFGYRPRFTHFPIVGLCERCSQG